MSRIFWGGVGVFEVFEFFSPEVVCKVNLKNFNIFKFKELLEVPQIKEVLDHC